MEQGQSGEKMRARDKLKAEAGCLKWGLSHHPRTSQVQGESRELRGWSPLLHSPACSGPQVSWNHFFGLSVFLSGLFGCVKYSWFDGLENSRPLWHQTRNGGLGLTEGRMLSNGLCLWRAHMWEAVPRPPFLGTGENRKGRKTVVYETAKSNDNFSRPPSVPLCGVPWSWGESAAHAAMSIIPPF